MYSVPRVVLTHWVSESFHLKRFHLKNDGSIFFKCEMCEVCSPVLVLSCVPRLQHSRRAGTQRKALSGGYRNMSHTENRILIFTFCEQLVHIEFASPVP